MLGTLPNYAGEAYELGDAYVYQSLRLNSKIQTYYFYTYLTGGYPLALSVTNDAASKGDLVATLLDSDLNAVSGATLTAAPGATGTDSYKTFTIDKAKSGLYFIKVEAKTKGTWIAQSAVGIKNWLHDLGQLTDGGSATPIAKDTYTFRPGFGEVWVAVRTPAAAMNDGDNDKLIFTLSDATYDLRMQLYGGANATLGDNVQNGLTYDAHCGDNGLDLTSSNYNHHDGNKTKTLTFSQDIQLLPADPHDCPDLPNDVYIYLRIYADDGHNSYGTFSLTVKHDKS